MVITTFDGGSPFPSAWAYAVPVPAPNRIIPVTAMHVVTPMTEYHLFLMIYLHLEYVNRRVLLLPSLSRTFFLNGDRLIPTFNIVRIPSAGLVVVRQSEV